MIRRNDFVVLGLFAAIVVVICGYREGQVLVIVSPSGTRCPIGSPSDWTVLEVSNYLAAVDGLPTASEAFDV